jgi:hypothetical protein
LIFNVPVNCIVVFIYRLNGFLFSRQGDGDDPCPGRGSGNDLLDGGHGWD